MFRGRYARRAPPEAARVTTLETPWIAAEGTFAMGDGCEILLVMDNVLAACSAFTTLPARKEGVTPGATNRHLPCFTADRIAWQRISDGRRLDRGAPEGRLICDEVAKPEDMDAAVGTHRQRSDHVGDHQPNRQPPCVRNRRRASRRLSQLHVDLRT